MVNFVRADEVVQTTWDALGAQGNVGIISNDNDVYSAFGINTVSDYIEKVVTPSINREVAEKSDHFDLVFKALSKFDEATSREFISDTKQTLRFDENALSAMGLSDYGELKVDVYGSGLAPAYRWKFWISYIDAEITPANIPYNGGYDYWNGHKML